MGTKISIIGAGNVGSTIAYTLTVTGAASEEIAEKIGCKIHMYDRLGHAAYEEAKDFNQVVYKFLIG